MDLRILARRRLLGWLATPLLALLLLTPAGDARAEDPPGTLALQERELSFQGRLGDALQRTLTVVARGGPVANVRFVCHDLVDGSTGVVILAGDISIDPATVERIADQQTFNITIAKASRIGDYRGVLELRYDEQPATAPLTLTLRVQLSAAPSVDADVNGKNLTLFVQKPWYEIPYVGQPAADPNGPPQSEVTLNLVQSGEGGAEVREASVLTLRDSQSRTLPSGIVRVGMTAPITIGAGGVAPLPVVVAGKNLAAGEYSGTLRVLVRDQAAPIQLPITVRVKHGWLAPLLVLAAGLATAYVFGYWNSSGKATSDLVEPIRALAADVKKRDRLQAGERDQAIDLLREAFAGINEGRPPGQIQTQFDAAKQLVAGARAAADALLNDKVVPARSAAKSVDAGRPVRDDLIEKLDAIEARVRAGKYRRLADADDAAELLRKQVDYYKTVVGYLASVDAAKRDGVSADLERQTTIYGLYQVLSAALEGSGVTMTRPPQGPGAFGTATPPPDARAYSDAFELTPRRRFQFAGTRALVGLVAYGFTLVVGYVSLYAASATFGAQPTEYISLFLWGAVVETVRGQTVTFGGLQTLFKEKGQPPAPAP